MSARYRQPVSRNGGAREPATMSRFNLNGVLFRLVDTMRQLEAGRTFLWDSGTPGWKVALALMAMLLASPAAAEEAAPPLPPPRPSDLPVPSPASPESKRTDAGCTARLSRQGVRFETRPATPEGECKIGEPVVIVSLPGDIAVSVAAPVECSFAEQLSRWMVEVVKPEAERRLQSAPTKLLIGTSYQCRDQRSGGKLSEHAFGNAVDVMGFELAGRPALSITERSEVSPEAAFQSAIREGACTIFTTVLGPGSDAAHGDHLHLDMRGRKDDYRICQ